MAETLQSWEYLEHLQGVELHRLYRSPPSALAVFRKLLSALAKHFVMMMLFQPRPIPAKDLELMVDKGSSKDRQMALEQLHRYHIIRDVTVKNARAFTLAQDFAKSLKQVLCGANSSRSFGKVVTVADRDAVTVEDLDEFARAQWEGILEYTVGSSSFGELHEPGEETVQPSAGVVELLKAGHLIELIGTQSRGYVPRITKEGFAFVLKDVNTQIWALLFLYVENAEALDMDKIEVLSFLFFIASLELGLAYSTENLDETQVQVLRDLLSLGIVYQSRPDAPYFFPTRLATTLTSESSTTLSATNATLNSSLSAPVSSSSTSSKGFIIIETNYRVYAYTSSPLQIALLTLFVNLRSRHPNLVTGKMTKSSVQRAIQAGVTAEQIISYLTTHAHPQMRRHAATEQAQLVARNQDKGRTVPIVPATILDQIHLWQLERDRMTTTNGYLLKDFEHRAQYEAPCRYADEVGVLVWKNDKKMMFFVNKIEAVQEFMRDRKEKQEKPGG